jgi:hypothetical protein
MSFADPQTINSVNCPRTGSGIDQGQFRSADQTHALKVQHQYGKRTRRTIRFDHNKIAADPLTAENTRYSMSAYLVVDMPTVGYSVAEAKVVVDALVAYLTASTGLKVSMLLGGEN